MWEENCPQRENVRGDVPAYMPHHSRLLFVHVSSFGSLNREEIRTQFHKQLELEAAADREAQLRLKREIAEQDRLADQHYHDLMMADVEARMRREELETIERNRANHVQVQALIEQMASMDNSKAARAQRIAEEHQYLVVITSHFIIIIIIFIDVVVIII